MQSIQHLSSAEQQHFVLCECGHYVDMRDLSDVFRHLHAKKLPEPQWSHSIRKGDAEAYTSRGRTLDLN